MGDRIKSILPLSPIQTWGGAFVLYASLSLLWSAGGWTAGAQLASLVLAFVIGTLIHDLRSLWGWAILAACANLALIPWMPWGLAGNPNYLGCGMALCLTSAIVYRFWPAIPPLALGLAYSGSRGAMFAAGVACLVALWSRHKAVAVGLVILITAAALYHTDHRGNSFSIAARLGIWIDTVNHATLLGSGFGSFYESYWQWPVHINLNDQMTGVRASHAYNDFIELGYELGIGAIPLWIFLALCFDGQGPARLICATFLLLGLTFFPLSVPIVAQAFALTLGHLTRSRKPETTQWHDIALKTSTT